MESASSVHDRSGSGEQLAPPVDVMAESAGRQDDTAACVHRVGVRGPLKANSDDSAVLVGDQRSRRRGDADLDAGVEGRTQQPAYEGRAIDELLAASFHGEVDQVSGNTECAVPERFR